ncbi:thiol:disulfide interchange protein [Billgrantia gudaonensis]|uniref:Thiol:disulfide interchange protein n=1 Tax=Billgrantia gudaonensis TaxID=376427 RepID=A0A432JJZ9_9GAMM|nr:thiol:disulfide interchange protein [Halomonas gudaonensis]
MKRFLPVMEAFQPSAWHDGETLYIGFENAAGYYLYRHRLDVESRHADVSWAKPTIPQENSERRVSRRRLRLLRTRRLRSADRESPLRPAGLVRRFPRLCRCRPLLSTGSRRPRRHRKATCPQPSPAGVTSLPATTANLESDRVVPVAVPSPKVGMSASAVDARGQPATGSGALLPGRPGAHLHALRAHGADPVVDHRRPEPQPTSGLHALGQLRGAWPPPTRWFGVLMGLFGAGLNLQARLQSAPVLITFAVLFASFALAMFRSLRARLPPRLAGRVERSANSLLLQRPERPGTRRALSVLVVSPCVSAPLAGALVFISTTGDALMGGAALLTLGLGMGIPLLLVGTFGTTALPRSGAWMNGVKVAFGILLLGVAIWLIERLVPAPVALLLWAALAIGSALALGALTVNQAQGWPRVRQAAGLLLLAWGLALVIGAASGARIRYVRWPHSPHPARAHRQKPSPSPPWRLREELERALQQASSQGLPAFVHVTADWCISCKQLERKVYPDPRVAEPLTAFSRINLDVTRSDDVSRRPARPLRPVRPTQPAVLRRRQGN